MWGAPGQNRYWAMPKDHMGPTNGEVSIRPTEEGKMNHHHDRGFRSRQAAKGRLWRREKGRHVEEAIITFALNSLHQPGQSHKWGK